MDVNYENFINDINVGDVVLIDNGQIHMKVLQEVRNKVECEVLTPGTLGSRRHINLPGVKVSLPALTAKDLSDVPLGLEFGSGLPGAVLRPRSQRHRATARPRPSRRAASRWSLPRSKISRPIANLDAIITASRCDHGCAW